MMRIRLHKNAWTILSYVILIVAVLLAGGPLIIVIFASFKGQFEIVSNTASLLPEQFSLYWFKDLLHKTDFLIYVKNSLVYSSLSTVLGMTISSLAAYAITRFGGKKQKNLTRVIVMTYMFPPILLAIPYFILVSNLGFTNTLPGLLIAYMSFTVPFCTYLLVSYFRTVPKDIEEAAMIDGLRRPGVFLYIALPLVTPGLVATAIFAFINAWNYQQWGKDDGFCRFVLLKGRHGNIAVGTHDGGVSIGCDSIYCVFLYYSKKYCRWTYCRSG